ncbi:MAG: SGNH/GDSL hydrolase family protein [Chitinophagaceae bacterium]
MKYNQRTRRRSFIKNFTALSTAIIASPELLTIKISEYKPADDYTILFQGDSITDGNRARNNDWNHVMGHGYQYIISSKLWYDFPKRGFHFFNRGISGNKITDLAARWQTDTLDIKPDLLSILIGINDVSKFIEGDNNFTAVEYESGYRTLLQQTLHTLPGIQLVLCEPFVLPVGRVKDKWQQYADEVKKRGEIVQKLSTEFNAIFVPFQDAFNKALSRAEADYWIWDGIHPMPAGHELMAIEWMKAVSKKIKRFTL